MGLLIDGKWQTKGADIDQSVGRYQRPEARFREKIENDETARFKPEAGRYHMYVSLGCPWAHRALLMRKLKGLEDLISVDILNPYRGDHGWSLSPEKPGCTADSVLGKDYLWQIYCEADEHYTGRVTLPVLWDKKEGVIVNNESADIMRMLNSEFDSLTGNTADFCPRQLRVEIDRMNEIIFESINDGVYRAGLATTQTAYEQAYEHVFLGLDEIERLLSKRTYLCGDTITEADWRLFVTLIRFDTVYYSLFKCNRQRLEDYENLPQYLRSLYQVPGVRETCDFDHIKKYYYGSYEQLNPSRVIPLGPDIDYLIAHNRSTTYLM